MLLTVLGRVIVCLSFLYVVVCEHKDDGKAPRLPLNDGSSIPALGLGTFLGFDKNGQKKVEKGDLETPMLWALDAGYRMFDTAQAYRNAEEIGSAVHKTAVPRDNIYIVDKLAPNRQREPVAALRDSLQLMNLSYVDLYLIHNPVAFTKDDKHFDVVDYVDTWKGMEEARKLGLAKSIGVSNFNETQMVRLLENSEVKPAVLQIEVNINLAQHRLVDFCKQHNIVVMAYTPFGSVFNPEGTHTHASDPKLVKMAEKYEKTVAQIMLRYLVQRGIAPIPKSVKKSRIEENIDVFDFELSNEDMQTLLSMNKDYRTVFPSFWQDHPYYPHERKEHPDPDIFHRE